MSRRNLIIFYRIRCRHPLLTSQIECLPLEVWRFRPIFNIAISYISRRTWFVNDPDSFLCARLRASAVSPACDENGPPQHGPGRPQPSRYVRVANDTSTGVDKAAAAR